MLWKCGVTLERQYNPAAAWYLQRLGVMRLQDAAEKIHLRILATQEWQHAGSSC